MRSILQAKLINHYIDVIERPSYHEIWEEAYVTLTALHLDHSLRPRPAIGGIILFESMLTITVPLRNAIMQAEASTPGVKSHKSMLWALFVGAQVEKSQNAIDNRDLSWFRTRFRDCALSMGLIRWAGVEKILRRHPYAEEIKPNGAEWMEDLLKVRCGADGKVEQVNRAWDSCFAETAVAAA